MPKFNCPHCNETLTIPEGVAEYVCEYCDYTITVSYKLEKIEGDPVSFLLKRAASDGKKETEIK